MQALDHAGVPATTIMELRNQVAVREAVAAGLGVAPELIGGINQDKRLQHVTIADVQITCRDYVTCRKNRFRLRKIQAFFDVVKAVAPALAERKILTLP